MFDNSKIKSNDYEYINIDLRNSSNLPIRARYYESRQNAILDNPELYDLAVVRFSCPTSSIPILVFKDNYYIVQMSYNITTIIKPVVWVPNDNKPVQLNKWVFSYQEMLDMINTAITSAYTDLKTAEPFLPNTAPPFYIYDTTTSLFSLCALSDWSNVNTGILYLNNPLAYLFDGIFQTAIYTPITATNISLFKQVIKDNKNNTITLNSIPYLEMKQEYRSLNIWSQFQSLIFSTDTIPVNAEYLSTINSDGKNENRRILTDFLPTENNFPRDLTALQYFPSGIPRYYSMNSNKEFRTIDIRVEWQDTNGILRPIYLNQFEELSIKIQLRRKSNLIP